MKQSHPPRKSSMGFREPERRRSENPSEEGGNKVRVEKRKKRKRVKHCCIQSLLSLVLVAEFTVTEKKKKVSRPSLLFDASSAAAGDALTDTEIFPPRRDEFVGGRWLKVGKEAGQRERASTLPPAVNKEKRNYCLEDSKSRTVAKRTVEAA